MSATCTEPMKCSICGKTKGEAIGHTWREATCTEPKKCSICGTIEGEPLGHSTDFGICSNCGSYVGKETVDEIDDSLSKIIDILNNANLYLQLANPYNLFDMLTEAADEMDKSKEEYDKIVKLCDSHKELNELKTLTIKARNSIPSGPKAETESEKSRFVEETDKHMDDFKSFSDEAIRLIDLYTK